MKFKQLLPLGLTLVALGAAAQGLADTDWKETEAPPPPAFNQAQLIPITMPSFVSIRFGVDPATLTITPDGIVRYVMVATNPTGSINAMYEGIRCATWEVKSYARYTTSGQWISVANPQWRGLNENRPSHHALALARQGGCEDGRTVTPTSAPSLVNALKNNHKTQIR
jgi:hypothetical protein